MAKKLNSGFWNGKRVLITGHTGFKGSWLSIWLHSMGAVLRGAALEPATAPSMFEIANVENVIESCIVDIRDFNKIRECIAAFKPEIIFHMAAQPLVRLSYEQPLETYETNIMGTLNVLEAARSVGCVRSIINITTDKCYENREWFWGYRENEPMGGHDPYSSSKGCVEIASESYRRSFLNREGIAMATARAGNVIGGGDWSSDRLLPDILRSIEANKPVVIRNPKSIRPWQHVLEPLSGYLILGEKLYGEQGLEFTEGWNFGPIDDDARPVQWIVEKVCNAWSHEAEWSIEAGKHPHEANFLKLDISKARQRLNWFPHWNLEVALEKTISWHRAWINGEDMSRVCLEQIDSFVS